MGFFKGMRDLQKQANEISKDYDPAAQMQAATELMAAQNAAQNAAVNGLEGTATVVAVRQQAVHVNHQPTVELDLLVNRDGAAPYPATVKQVVQQIHLARAQPGASVHVKVDPADPALVWVDWARVA